MKKSLLMMAAALTAWSASAQLYVTGGAVEGAAASWSSDNPLAVEAADGVYTFQATGEFKISTSKGTWDEYNAGAYQLDGSWNVNGESATANLRKGDQNITPAKNGAVVTYTVKSDLSSISASLTGGEVEKFYNLHGDIFGDPSWSSQAMTKNGNVWEWTGEVVNTGNFGMKITNASGAQIDWIGGGAAVAAANQSYSFTAGDNSSCALTGEYTVVYDPEAQTIIFKGEGGSEPIVDTPDHLYIVGYLATDNWNPATASELTKSGNSFSISDIELVGQANFSFLTQQGSWDEVNATTRYGAEVNGTRLTFNDNNEATSPMVSNVGDVGAFITSPAKYDMTVTFTATGTELKVVRKSEVIVVEDLVLTGSFNGWAMNDQAYKFTKEGNIYTLTLPSMEEGTEFKVKTAEDNWASSWGADGTGLDDTAAFVPVTLNTAMNSWFNSSLNFHINNTLENVVIKFEKNEDDAASQLTVSADIKSGVEAVEAVDANAAAVYYNLQGMRIAAPQAGQLYIVDRAGKISKEIAR